MLIGVVVQEEKNTPPPHTHTQLFFTHPRHAESAVDPPLPSRVYEEDVSLSILWLLEDLHLLEDHL